MVGELSWVITVKNPSEICGRRVDMAGVVDWEVGEFQSGGGTLAQRVKLHLALVVIHAAYGGYFVIAKACLSGGVDPLVFAVYRDVIGCSVLFFYAAIFERSERETSNINPVLSKWLSEQGFGKRMWFLVIIDDGSGMPHEILQAPLAENVTQDCGVHPPHGICWVCILSHSLPFGNTISCTLLVNPPENLRTT